MATRSREYSELKKTSTLTCLLWDRFSLRCSLSLMCFYLDRQLTGGMEWLGYPSANLIWQRGLTGTYEKSQQPNPEGNTASNNHSFIGQWPLPEQVMISEISLVLYKCLERRHHVSNATTKPEISAVSGAT